MFRIRSVVLALGVLILSVVVPAAAQQPADCPTPDPPYYPNDCAPLQASQTIPFTGDTGPMRVRKSAWQLSSTELTNLQNAFTALRALPQSDPRSWYATGLVHCWQCGGGNDGAQGEEIHFSYLFFPWHRSYLYFLEKILGNLANDPTLALPYWDWDDPQHTTMPPIYNGSPNPLYDQYRGAVPTDQIPPQYVGTAAMTKAMGAKNWETFMGTQPSVIANHGGSIENGPHGVVHLWTGDPQDLNNGGCSDMGVLTTAAFDPIFFSHHGNIDRLWTVWLATSANPPHTNPPDCPNPPVPGCTNWSTNTFYFYDENKQWRSITAADVVEYTSSLHYQYQADTTATPAVASRAMTTKPMTVKSKAAPPVAKAMPPAAASWMRLNITNVSVPEGQSANVRVFVEKSDANATTSISDPHYVGYFTIVPHTRPGRGHAHAPRRHDYVFDLTPEQQAMIKDPANVNVTLVPVSRGTIEPKRIGVSVGDVFVETVNP